MPATQTSRQAAEPIKSPSTLLTLAELHRGLEERRELIRSGAFAKSVAAMRAAQEKADAE